MSRPSLDGFWSGDQWRRLVEPHGEPTGRQLLALNRAGMLALVPPGHADTISKGEAAYAIPVTRKGDR